MGLQGQILIPQITDTYLHNTQNKLSRVHVFKLQEPLSNISKISLAFTSKKSISLRELNFIYDMHDELDLYKKAQTFYQYMEQQELPE